MDRSDQGDGSNDSRDALERQQKALAQFGGLALRSEDLDEILTEACRLVGDALGTDLAKVMELEPGDRLKVRAGVGWKPGVVGVVEVPVDSHSSEGHALTTREAVASRDIATETRFTYADFIKEHGVRALVNVVILGADGAPPYGILEVDSRSPRDFGEGDITFLQGYANLLAATVERLRGLDRRREVEAALRTEVAERRRLEEDLRQANESLERRVEERTRALTASEARLRQGQKMEAIGQLTGGIAHDFNNLLTGITGSLDLIRRRIAGGKVDEVGRFIDAASTSAQRAAALTHRLLAFSRQQSLDARPVAINALVTGMEELLHRTLGERIRLRTVLAADLWPGLCDHNQLESAILNLAINGRDAMPDGGELKLTTLNVRRERAETVQGEEVAPGDYVAVSVTDTGTGMTPEVAAKAFDPFFTTKPIGQGTGLGLSMIYGFAKQSDGFVKIESAPGAGTTITLELPRATGPVEAVHVQSGDTPTGRGETVLVVEDDVSVRLLVTEVLRELGYRFIEAVDAAGAESILRSDVRIDLMVSDVGLPGPMNGRQLARLAREIRPAMRVLLVTGYVQSAVDRARFVADRVDLLTKPFSLDVLGTKIRELMER